MATNDIGERVSEAQGLIVQHLIEEEELGGDMSTGMWRRNNDVNNAPPRDAHTFHVAVPNIARLAPLVMTIGLELTEWSQSPVYWDARGRTDGEGVDLYFHVDVSDPEA